MVAVYVILPQLGDFRASWQLLRHPTAAWTVLAVLLSLLTYLLAAATYYLLAFKPLRYGPTVLVQAAATFINRLLPGGLGALGANYAYLRHERHTVVQAASVTAINNIIGALGHGLLAAACLMFFPSRVIPTSISYSSRLGLLVGFIAIGLIMLGVLALIFGKQKFVDKVTETRQQVLSYRHRPGRLAVALVTSVLLTTANVLCLLCCALALGVQLPFAAVLLVLSFGVGAGTFIPTPGGLGGFEAGLVAGFIAYDVSGATALAAALLFRLVSYWLPLAIGALALVAAGRRQLFTPR